MTYVLATTNSGKVCEMRAILSGLDIDIITRDEIGIAISIEETGRTFLENAKIKAQAICTASNMPSIADDSGLVVEALGGEPGVYSSSYGGEELTSEKRCEFLLKKMENIKLRHAKYVCIIACVFPNGSIITVEGECKGRISTEAKGDSGFGYDPVFIPDGMDKTMAELSSGEKNLISHRGIALVKLSKLLMSDKAGKSI